MEDVDYVSAVPISDLGRAEHEHTQSVRLREFAANGIAHYLGRELPARLRANGLVDVDNEGRIWVVQGVDRPRETTRAGMLGVARPGDHARASELEPSTARSWPDPAHGTVYARAAPGADLHRGSRARRSLQSRTMALADLDLDRYDSPPQPRLAAVDTPWVSVPWQPTDGRMYRRPERFEVVVLTIARLCPKSLGYEKRDSGDQFRAVAARRAVITSQSVAPRQILRERTGLLSDCSGVD